MKKLLGIVVLGFLFSANANAGINEPGKNILSDKDLINHCKKTVKTCWHPVGTCKMGIEKNDLAVVTPDLKVKGIHNLRIFDASVMPNLISGNTNAPTMALADRAVDIMMNKINIL